MQQLLKQLGGAGARQGRGGRAKVGKGGKGKGGGAGTAGGGVLDAAAGQDPLARLRAAGAPAPGLPRGRGGLPGLGGFPGLMPPPDRRGDR